MAVPRHYLFLLCRLSFPGRFSPCFPVTVPYCKLFSSINSLHWTTIPCSLSIPTKLYVMNAKACTVVELYGTLDPVTRDWTDGLLSCIFREINKPTDKNERKYIVFDSDVDALWVENMNSVMDDNRLLTLANGERIRLQKHCALLFEVMFLCFTLFTPCVVWSLPASSYMDAWDRRGRNENHCKTLNFVSS